MSFFLDFPKCDAYKKYVIAKQHKMLFFYDSIYENEIHNCSAFDSKTYPLKYRMTCTHIFFLGGGG